MRSRSRRIASAIAAVGLFTIVQSGHAQTTTNWSGTNSTAWTDPGNWSALVPGTSSIADFNGAGNGNVNISLGGTTQTTGAIQFDSASTASYDVGTTAGDVLSLGDGSINVTGPLGVISVSSTVTLAEEIDANISLTNVAPFITDAATNGPLTLGASSTSNTITTASGTTGMTIALANNSTIKLNDIITGSVGGGQGATSATGGLSLTGTGTVIFNGQNTYSGITNLNNGGGGVTVQIGSSSTLSGSTLVSGPFGTSTLTPDSGTQSPLQAVGADRTVANPVQMDTGFTVSNAATPFNLTLTGPMVLTTSQGRTVTVNIPGQTLTLGSATTPSTLTLSTNNTFNLAFDTTANSTLVINDVIQNGAGTNSVMSYTPVGNNTPEGTVLITGANTYSGGTTFAAQTSGTLGALTVEIGSSSGTLTGPFGSGAIIMNDGNAPPILEAHGADRTVANAITLTSGFWASGDASGAHNLTLSGAIGTDSKVITNNTPSGAALILGTAGSPSTLILNGATFQSQVGSGAGGVTIINDLMSGTSVSFKQGGVYYINNTGNSYTGNTSVLGNGTGAAGLGTGATLAGTGNVGTGTGIVTIGSATAGSVGGIVAPGGDGATHLTAIGTLVVPNLALEPFGRYVYQFDPTNADIGGTTNDLVSIVGNLNVSALSSKFDLDLAPLAAGAPQAQYTLATFATLTGASAGQDVTSSISFSGTTPAGYTPTITVAGDGKSLLLNFAAVPEPGTLSLLGIAGLGLVRRRRR